MVCLDLLDPLDPVVAVEKWDPLVFLVLLDLQDPLDPLALVSLSCPCPSLRRPTILCVEAATELTMLTFAIVILRWTPPLNL